MATVNNKCRAKNPSACIDPQCPEKRWHAQMSQKLNSSRTYSQYEKTAKKLNSQSNNQAKQKFINENVKNQKLPNGVEIDRDGHKIYKFHKDIGFPPSFIPPSGPRALVYSKHATEQRTDDIYGDIPHLSRINLDKMELIELKLDATTKTVSRYLYRAQMDEHNDVCLVLKPIGKGKMLVVTNWINTRNDAHKTLNKNKYVEIKKTA